MARLLSQQDDFKNQESMLKTLIKKAGHECISLPKFHCELNPIEMVRANFVTETYQINTNSYFSIGDGQSITIVKFQRMDLLMQKNSRCSGLIRALMKSFGTL